MALPETSKKRILVLDHGIAGAPPRIELLKTDSKEFFDVVATQSPRETAPYFFRALMQWIGALPAVKRVVAALGLLVAIPAFFVTELVVRVMCFCGKSLHSLELLRASLERILPVQVVFRSLDQLACNLRDFDKLIDETSIALGAIETSTKRIDILYCHSLAGLFAGFLGNRIKGLRLVLELDQMPTPQSALEAMVWRYLLSKPSQVIVPNYGLVREVSKYVEAHRIFVIANAEANIERTSIDPDQDMELLSRGRVKFLVQADDVRDEGMMQLVRAFKKVNPTEGALFIRAPESLGRDALEELALKLGLFNKRVYFLDPIPGEDPIGLAMAADVGMLPYMGIHAKLSHREFSQYIHAGLALVVTPELGVADDVKLKECGIVCQANTVEALANALQTMISDVALRNRCAENTARFAAAEYNRGAQAKALVEALNRQLTAQVAG